MDNNDTRCQLLAEQDSVEPLRSNGPFTDLKTTRSGPGSLRKIPPIKISDAVSYSALSSFCQQDSAHKPALSSDTMTTDDGEVTQRDEIELLLDSRNGEEDSDLIILQTRSTSKSKKDPAKNSSFLSVDGKTSETSLLMDSSKSENNSNSDTPSKHNKSSLMEPELHRDIRIRSLEDVTITQSDESLEDQASAALLLTDRGSPSVRLTFSRSSRTSRFTDRTAVINPCPGTSYRFPLILEGDVRLCLVLRTRSLLRKFVTCTCLRRWEKHRIRMENIQLSSSNHSGVLGVGIRYTDIANIELLPQWDTKKKYHFGIHLSEHSSIVIQTNTRQLRDQWFHSLHWKRFTQKYDQLTVSTLPPDELVSEIKRLVELVASTPLSDPGIETFTLNVISALLHEDQQTQNLLVRNEIILSLAPLLEAGRASVNMCDFFSLHGRIALHSQPLLHLFAPIIYGILKHNMDFGKYPVKRLFVQEYIQTLRIHDGPKGIERFIASIHGPAASCPHLRILPNVVSICVATVHAHYDDLKRLQNSDAVSERESASAIQTKREQKLLTHIEMLLYISEHPDWRLELASLLQPVPFPHDSLRDSLFTQNMKRILWNIGDDVRCQVHTAVLSVRDGKDGWFELYCPGGVACDSVGDLYAIMLRRLMGCCCRRKKFLQNRLQMINPWQTMARDENSPAIEALCAVLEFNICDSVELKKQITESLQTTEKGRHEYSELCKRQILLNEIQQKGGPRKITLPPRSSDVDLSKLLCSGSFGSLECLSLAFTNVTSACAVDIIKLPGLRYLNLWCTQFGDAGLLLISEHMTRLQVLNLCETPVTDKGIKCLTALKSLRKLNLNSTKLTAATFDLLKENLPVLEEYDIRYTDAW